MKYFFDWNDLEDFSEYYYDPDGIPRVLYRQPIGIQYNPITIAQFGLDSYNQFCKSPTPENRQNTLKTARWLIQNFETTAYSGAVWYYRFDLDFYPTKAPWISAMAQGEAISLLLRANSLEENPDFIKTAERAALSFEFPITAGGVCATFADGSLSFEEYPSVPPSHVLNGSIFAIFGLYDYMRHSGNQKISAIFEKGINGLRANLSQYDTGFWSRYDLFPRHRLASPNYQKIHIQLLNELANITGISEFHETAERWQYYLKNPVCRLRWGISKVWEKYRLKYQKH